MDPLPESRVTLDVGQARRLSDEVLRAIGYAADEAALIRDHVLDAAFCGYEYSGLPKLLNVAELRAKRGPPQALRTVYETPVSARLDGGQQCGMVAMVHAADIAIAKARAQGFAVVGLNNIWMSGRSAHYVERIARAGLIAIHTVSSRPQVAPPGARVAGMGTNPIAFGFPTRHDPLVIDLGTAAIMYTDVALRARTGELLPDGVAIDAAGQPTCDAAAALAGAALPFGGYKGFALGLAMRALGVMAGSAQDGDGTAGYLVLAMKPDLLVPEDEYRQELSAALARLKALPRQPGVVEIRLPSERAFRQRARALAEGIVIDRHVFDALSAIAARGAPAP